MYAYGISRFLLEMSALTGVSRRSELYILSMKFLLSAISSAMENSAGCEMYAYGISRFLLEMSDEELVRRFWDNLVWCLDFALSRKTADGIIQRCIIITPAGCMH